MVELKEIKHFANKVAVFLNPDKASYWHTITRNTLVVKPQELGRYYLDFSSKFDFPGKIDDNGIPLFSFRKEEYFYHPIVICQYALGIYEQLYKSNYKNEMLGKMFLNQAEWLLRNKTLLEIGTVWSMNFDIDEYGLYKPWYSVLTQGEAVSVLTRAFLLTKKNEFLQSAEDAIKMFDTPVSEGGLMNYFNGNLVFEEYPSTKRTVAVLNGFIFSLFGLYDLILLNNSPRASELFYKGILSLKKLLPFYDTGYWCRYYLFDYPKEYVASFTYMSIVFEQLSSLYYLTGEQIFLEYSKKWKEYSLNRFRKIRALIKKITYAKKLG